MSSLIVKGGVKLSAEITPQGAKNEALQVICATLLSDNDIIISNIPNIIDVVKLIDILKSLGVEVNKLEKGKYSFNSKRIDLRSFGGFGPSEDNRQPKNSNFSKFYKWDTASPQK